MGDTISITFDHALKDHLEAFDLNFRASNWYVVDKIVACLFLLLSVIAFSYLRFFTLGTVCLLIAFVEVGVIKQLSLPRMIYVYRFKKDARFKNEYKLEFSDDGLHFTTQGLDSRIDWSFYKRILINDNMTLLGYAKHQFTLIPKRAFDNEEDYEYFQKLIENKVGNIKRM